METRIRGLTDLFNQSIGLEEPWYIRSIETEGAEVHVYVDIREGNMMPCPECGKKCVRAGYEKMERVWRHGDVMFYPCYVHCRRPRIRCGAHKTKVVEAPWARKSSRFTLMFEGYAMLILADMPILKASKLLRCNEKSLVRILRYWVNRAVEADDLSKVESLSIDETSFKRGQSYVTVIIDAAKRRVIDVERGRSEETVIDFSYKLEAKGGDCERITFACSDMSKAYRSGIQFCFPKAKHTVDKFHVKKLMIDAMDMVRRGEQREQQSKLLHLGRRVLMIPEAKQDEKQRTRVAEISKEYPKTGRAYRMVQAIDTVYGSKDAAEAEQKLDQLYRWMRKSRLEPMKKTALTLREYSTEIMNIFHSKMTNAISEGINSMIQAAKRKARGYHTFEGFSSMIYLIAAKLQLAFPNPLRLLE
jgi:Transposase and inactivated derivatives